MTLPRQIQLRTLLIVVALCAFGTWWVIRPSQTAQWFVTDGYKTIPANGEEKESLDSAYFRKAIEHAHKIKVAAEKRSWRDVLVGKQSFSVNIDEVIYSFEVTRGTLTGGPELYADPRFTICF